MDVTLICAMFEGLPRQGPGSDECTAYACSFIPSGPRGGTILDIGCGTGMQTLALARLCPGSKITATDLHQPFLDELNTRAKRAGLGDRIVTHQASMDSLPFGESAFDIIWSEGAAFVMGLSSAITNWHRFLTPGGYLVVSDCTWFTDTPSDECREFFDAMCPDMKNGPQTEEIFRTAGYTVISSFRLPDMGWWDHYYTPLSERMEYLKEKYRGNPEAEEIIQGLEWEMDIHRKYSKEYGYTFFVARWGAGGSIR